MTSTKITTIADFIEYDMAISFFCQPCGRGGDIDLQRLGLERGKEFNLYDRSKPPLTCPHCHKPVRPNMHGGGTSRIRGVTRG